MSKEKQIEEMGFLILENSPLSKMSSEDLAEILYDEGYRKQSESTMSQVKLTEWISVDERLPDPTKNVLICKTFRGKPYIDIGCVKDAETCCCASDEFIIKPWLHKLTHWMPLPEPPKMKEGAA